MADGKGKKSRFDLIIGAVDQFSGTFKGFNNKVDKSSASVNRLQKSVSNLSRATGLTRLSSSTKNLFTGFKNVGSEARALVGTIGSLAAKASLLFGAAGGGTFAVLKSTANAGDAAAKASKRAGVGLRTWQEYAHVASLSSVSNEQLEKSFIKLQELSIKAFKGEKSQAGLLRLAGIDPKTAKGEIKNADSMFMELAEKVKILNESGQQAQAANLVKSLLGEEGTKLMPMLAAGAEGLKDLRLEAHKLGLVFSEEDATASEAFNDELTRAGASMKGIGYTIGRQLLPPSTKLIEKFNAWASSNREIIGTKFAEWVDGLDIDGIWNSIENGFGTLKRLGSGLDGIVQTMGGWETVLKGLAVLMSGKFALSIVSLIGNVGTFSTALLTSPFGLFILGLAGVSVAVVGLTKLMEAMNKTVDDFHNEMNTLYAEDYAATGGWAPPEEGEKREGSGFLKRLDGFFNIVPAQNNNPASGPPAGFAAAAAAGVGSVSRSEHVETNKLTIKLEPAEGLTANFSGNPGENVSFSQVGVQGMGG